MAGLRRHLQIVRWGKRVACSGSLSSAASSYIRVSKKSPSIFFFKQLVWKIRSKCKHYYLKQQQKSNAVQYSYDAQSYSQNFDSGHPVDRPSPFAP